MQGSGQVHSVLVTKGRGATTLVLPSGHPLDPKANKVLVRLGRMRLRARVVSASGSQADAKLELGGGISWPRGFTRTLSIRTDGRGTFHVGPVVAIMSAVYRRQRYGPQDTLFQRMITEANELGILAYVVSPGALRSSGRVLGYRHDGRRWRPAHFPPPDVLYNRTQATPATVALERGMRRRYGVRIFNGRLGSKWRQYRVLARDPELRRYLPATRLLRSGSDLRSIVTRFGGAYVKPSRGGFGRGVWRIERKRRGYDVRRTDRIGRSHRLGTVSLGTAFRAIRRRRRAYIVQQRLHLLRWRGSIADVRVLMQKDIHGVWRLTGAGVRVGQGGTIVSNLSGGGKGASLSDVVRETFADNLELAASIEMLVPEIAERIARRLERAGGTLGELGIDLAIDRDGRIWFLEANSRTGRNLFHQLDKEHLGRLADRRPMEFSYYLAGFRSEQSDR